LKIFYEIISDKENEKFKVSRGFFNFLKGLMFNHNQILLKKIQSNN